MNRSTATALSVLFGLALILGASLIPMSCNVGVTLNERQARDIAVDAKAGVWVIANDGSIWVLLNYKGPWRRVADLPAGEYINPPRKEPTL